MCLIDLVLIYNRNFFISSNVNDSVAAVSLESLYFGISQLYLVNFWGEEGEGKSPFANTKCAFLCKLGK